MKREKVFVVVLRADGKTDFAIDFMERCFYISILALQSNKTRKIHLKKVENEKDISRIRCIIGNK